VKKTFLILILFAGCSAGRIELPEGLAVDSCSARVKLTENYDQLGPVVDLFFEQQEGSVVVVGVSPIIGRELIVRISESGIVEEKVSLRFSREDQRKLVRNFLFRIVEREKSAECKLFFKFSESSR